MFKQTSKKIIILSIFALVLALSVPYLSNNKNSISAYEPEEPDEELLICQDVRKIQTSDIVQKKELTENILEIPIGRSTDFTEYLADELVRLSQLLANMASQEGVDVESIVTSISTCKEGKCSSNCETVPSCSCEAQGCQGTDSRDDSKCSSCSSSQICCCSETGTCQCVGCSSNFPYTCSGDDPDDGCEVCDCPAGDLCCCNIDEDCINDPCTGTCESIRPTASRIIFPASKVDWFYDQIQDFFRPRFWPLTLYSEQYGLDAKQSCSTLDLSPYIEIPGWLDLASSQERFGSCDMDICFRSDINPISLEKWEKYCISPVELHTITHSKADIRGYLEKAKDRMAKCVVRPYEEEALLRGEVSGKAMYDCRDILGSGFPIHSFLDNRITQGCYGSNYCKVKESRGEELPYVNSPCADDYYCCHFKND